MDAEADAADIDFAEYRSLVSPAAGYSRPIFLRNDEILNGTDSSRIISINLAHDTPDLQILGRCVVLRTVYGTI